MKKTYAMENLDCANCAAKMERAIEKLDGVTNVTISFMAQRVTIEADENDMPRILKQARKCVRKVDADCEILA